VVVWCWWVLVGVGCFQRHERHVGIGNLQEVRLPDRGSAVGGVGSSTLRNVAHKLPRPGTVSAGVEVDARAVVAPAVAGSQDGTSRKAAQGLGQLGKGRLRGHAPAIDVVGHVGHPLPAGAAILALEDGEVGRADAGEGRGRVDGTVLELGEARIRDALLTHGLVDGVVDEASERLGLQGGQRLCKSCRATEREERQGQG